MRGRKMLWVVILCVVVGVALLSVGTTLAWNIYTKSLDAQGRVDYTDEVMITEVKAVSMVEVSVTVDSTVDTQAGVTYNVSLYLDGVEAGTSPQSPATWTAQQTGGGNPRTVNFTGLDLTVVVSLEVEVGH